MSVAGLRALLDDARRVGVTVRSEAASEPVGPIAVSGMLADQLAKELAAGAMPGAVVVGGAEQAGRAEVLVRIVAGDPTLEDEELVRRADRAGVPIVLVQLWPQADWTRPFVLAPFVVECRAGEGFPVREIGDRIVDASPNAAALAAEVPAVAEAARAGAVRSAVVRSALLGLAGARGRPTRPLLTLEQVRLLSQLRTASGVVADDELRLRAFGAGGVLAAGFAFRGVARSLRTVLPASVADAVVAAAGTFALAKLAGAAEARLASRGSE